MTWLEVEGGVSLQGEVSVGGAKNAVTKILVATLLSEKRCTIRNVPNIGDVQVTLDLCRELGSEIFWDKENKIIEIQTKELKTTYIPQRFSGGNRIPILMIGALLGRTQEEIIVPTMGGCKIGERPVDFHIKALEQLGASVEYRNMKKEGAYLAHAHHGLKGTEINLPYPSVGATENAILASVRAQGQTAIKNAAVEPEVMELILFLQKMGVSIALTADRTIEIQECTDFKEADHTVMADRVVAASFALAAACTNGEILVKDAHHEHLSTFLNAFKKIGGDFSVKENGILFYRGKTLKAGLHLETDVFPGFLTDWQQPFVVLLTQAEGTSIIHETVYENRFGYTDTLKKMGGDLTLFSQCLGDKPCRYALKNHLHSLVVKGPTPLQGMTIEIPDLRAGFAYVLAGLIAKGKSQIKGAHFLHRGYEEIVSKLQNLGAKIQEFPLDHLEKEKASNKIPSQTTPLKQKTTSLKK